MACNFNSLFENEGLLKVTVNHIHCTCGNISETVPDSLCYNRPRIVAILMMVTFMVIYLLQAFSSVIFRTAVQQFTRFQLT